ncbi:hypothetical protein [Rufibacter psychrotolerans]|uniref:hypothetical protein n=1 Tax=Rufibacter psychrotolerans TaxID=2812556 RepID=UPI001967967A|nr:hypothetical protein [Rufibacter sp. SYSU D00308]
MDLLEKKELRKANGDVFFEAHLVPSGPYLYVNWVGIQTLETVVMGGNYILSILRQTPCQGLLNSNREVIGPWDAAVQYLAHKWAPAAQALGLRWMAHVLSPGIYGQRSFQQFKQQLGSTFTLKSFEDQEIAEEWLLLRLT